MMKNHQNKEEIMKKLAKNLNIIDYSDAKTNAKEKIIKSKDKEIKLLKSDNLKYKEKISTYEKDLEKFYMKKFEKESQKLKRNYEFQLKLKTEEKEKILNLLVSDVAKYKELEKQYQISFISLNDHELILNKVRNDLEKEIRMLKAKLDLTHFKQDESQSTNIDTNRNKNSKHRNACVISSLIKNFINVDTYDTALESTAKFSYTNTEYKECLTSSRNRDHKNMITLHRSTDANYLNNSHLNLNEKIYDNKIIPQEDKINNVKTFYPDLTFRK